MNGYFSRIPLLRALPTEERHKLAALSELRRFSKGQTIFEEGQQADSVWIVRRGWVYLQKRTTRGEPATIFAMTPHEVVCGLSACDSGTYSVSATSATDTQLIRIPADVFVSLLRRHAPFASAVLAVCCRRMRQMAEAMSYAHATAQQRLAYTLLRLRHTFGNTIPVTHQELAHMAGIRWETSIRTLAAMKHQGWVSSARGQMVILKPQQLHTTFEPSGRPSAAQKRSSNGA